MGALRSHTIQLIADGQAFAKPLYLESLLAIFLYINWQSFESTAKAIVKSLYKQDIT
tara:strand:- start:21 stop:191 length:171 start_codon:yes stop_codon:yes gene_type:complete